MYVKVLSKNNRLDPLLTSFNKILRSELPIPTCNNVLCFFAYTSININTLLRPIY